MAPPLGLAPLPTGDATPSPRPLLPPRQLTDAQRAAAFSFGQTQAAQAQGGAPPSLWDQVSGLVTGLPQGIADLGVQGAQSVAGIPRLVSDVAQQASGHSDNNFSTDFGTNLGEYFPALETFRGSFANTASDVRHPEHFKEASDQGQLAGKVFEDVANASLLAAPLSKALTAASGAERVAGADAAAQASRLAPRFVGPDAVAAETATRPGLLRAAQAVENAARPVHQAAGAPARVWTAPLSLLKGVDLPPSLFGTTDEGTPRQFGVKPLLDQTGVTQRITESPAGQAVGDAFTDWRDKRAMLKDTRETQLLPGSAQIHVLSTELNQMIAPARKILGDDAELMDANHLVRTGQTANLQVLSDLRGQIPDEQLADIAARTFGRERAPSERTIDVALDYANGTLDPALRARMDRAWGFQKRALDFVEQMKLEEGNLNPEQTGREPMQSKTAPIIGALQDRANQLRDEIHGARPGDVGLAGEAAAARARIPEPDMAQLAGQRATAAARQAGVLEGERLVQERTAERASQGEAAAGVRAGEARLNTIEGARSTMGQLQRDRYGFGDYQPEWTATQRQIGEAERAAGPPSPRYTVPDDELALAQHIARLEGQGRTGPVERSAGVAERAAGRADVAGQAGAAAQGRIFTGAAEPIMAPGRGELPFGQASIEDRARIAPMSDKEASGFVREARQAAVQKIEERITATTNRIARVMDGPIEIPRPGSPMSDAWDMIRNELGTYINNFKLGGERLFKKSLRGDAGGGLGTGFEAAGQRMDSLDAFLERYDPGEPNINTALEAFIDDMKELQDLREQRGAVARDGVRDPSLIAEDPVELAALTGDRASAMREVQLAHADQILPPAEHGPAPWTMDREAYKVELGDVQGELASVANVPFEQWPASALQAERRMLELTPEVIEAQGLTADALYDRIREVAQVVGRDVAPETATAPLLGAETAGRAATSESRMLAQDALELDPLTRERAAAEGRPVTPDELIFTMLTPDERIIYRQLAEQSKAEGAQGRLEGARSRLTEGLRTEGERAGQRVGEAVGQERLLGRQADVAGQRAETLAPRVDTAAERAQSVAEQEAGKPLRFGERRGKLIRDAQTLERALRTKEGRLRWLEDERIPAEQARLEQGPREVAPGAYVPPLLTGQRLKSAVTEMGAALAEQTGDPAIATKFEQMVADVPATMDQLHERGIYPEYLPGAVDRPTKGTPTVAGSQEQLPWERATPSQHRKQYGHVPQEVTTVQRSLVNEIRGIVENRTAATMRDEIATPGHQLLDELVRKGEMSTLEAERLRAGSYDRTVDLAVEMERHHYTAWDPAKPQLPGDRHVTADSFFLPTPIANEFQRWWKPASKNPLIVGYDMATRGFKHSVLAMSPTWNVNNVLGNAFMAVVFGGETPLEIYRRTREVMASARQAGREERMIAPEDVTRTQRVMEAIPGGRRLREWGKDIAAAPALGPPRLYGAGGPSEIMRQMAEQREPGTMFGRGINQAYRVNETVDNIGRNALYLAKRGKGFSEEEAVAQALNAMGDFNNKTPFERDVVRRIIPFYAWMKHVTQASYHLAAEHPFRTAWLLHVSDMFNPGSDNMPDWLRGSIGIGKTGWVVPMGGANPLQGNFGSVFTAGHDWPGELMRGLSPLIKLGAAGVGINLQTRRPVSGPPGAGPVDQYGKPIFGLQTPSTIAYMAARMIPQGRMLEDLLQAPVLRYDTGQPVKSRGQTIPLQAGKGGQLLTDLRIPFFPSYVDQQQAAQRIAKGRATVAKQKAGYNR